MTINIELMSPMKLKGLKTGEGISIRHARSQQEIDDGASRVILDRFPKRVATAFSTTWATLFPSLHQMGPADLSRPKHTSVTVVGGSVDTVRSILSWVLSCCEGHGMQPFPHVTIKPFTQYYTVKESADNMGIQILSQEMTRRLNKLASRQIHSEDIRAMYLRMPNDHPILQDLGSHVADLIWARKLRAFNVYKTLRDEIPQFDQHINAVLDKKKAAQKPQQGKQHEKEQEESGNHNCSQKQDEKSSDDPTSAESVKSQGGTTTPVSQRSDNDSEAHQVNTLSHRTIRCTVARKARKGRPAYVNLPLGAAGLTKNDFIGNTVTESFPIRTSPRPVGKKMKMTASKKGRSFDDIDHSVGKGNKRAQRAISSPTCVPPTACAENKATKDEVGGDADGRSSSVFSTRSLTSASLISAAESVETATTADSLVVLLKKASVTE